MNGPFDSSRNKAKENKIINEIICLCEHIKFFFFFLDFFLVIALDLSTKPIFQKTICEIWTELYIHSLIATYIKMINKCIFTKFDHHTTNIIS